MFSADLYYHKTCYLEYYKSYSDSITNKFNDTAKTSNIETNDILTAKLIIKSYIPEIKRVINHGNGISLSEIRELIQDNENITIHNKQIKSTLSEGLGKSIQFCTPDRTNQSLFVYSMSVSTEDIINTIRSLDKIKSAAKSIRTALKQVDFKLQDRFSDAEELKQSWLNTKIPDELLTFFSELFDIKKTKLIEEYHNETVSDDAKNDQFPRKYSKIGSSFQILYYDLHNGYKKTGLDIMNACEIYEKCKSKELITSFNQSGLCVSYHSMKRHRTDLAKYVIKQTNDTEITVPLPSHFSASSFTLSEFDNFDHNDNSSLSGKKAPMIPRLRYFK